MGNLKIRSQVLGIVGTNCYLAFDDEMMEGVIIDPADNGPVILNQCRELGVTPKAVLLTHGHFDPWIPRAFRAVCRPAPSTAPSARSPSKPRLNGQGASPNRFAE